MKKYRIQWLWIVIVVAICCSGCGQKQTESDQTTLNLKTKTGDIDPLDIPHNELKFLSEIGVCTQSSNLSMAEQSGASYVEESVRRFLVPTEPDLVFRYNLANVPGGNISIVACNSFLPGKLKSVDPNAVHKTILAYADTPFEEQRRQGLKLWFSGVADRAKYRRVLIRIQPGLSLFLY